MWSGCIGPNVGARCLPDEVQFLLMPEQSEGSTATESAIMRNIVLRTLLLMTPKTQVMVFTGSTRALTWQALADIPKMGVLH